jgi:hypothetical protein
MSPRKNVGHRQSRARAGVADVGAMAGAGQVRLLATG